MLEGAPGLSVGVHAAWLRAFWGSVAGRRRPARRMAECRPRSVMTGQPAPALSPKDARLSNGADDLQSTLTCEPQLVTLVVRVAVACAPRRRALPLSPGRL